MLACSLGEANSGADISAQATITSLQLTNVANEAILTAQAALPTATPFPTATTAAPAEPTSDTPVIDQGAAITGNLSYPAEKIPGLFVVAFDAQTLGYVTHVETQPDQSTYTLQVPNGTYVVVAYTLDAKLAAGYTQAVVCGLTAACTDHSLIPVPAANGGATGEINPTDWYAPPGTFPPFPVEAGPPVSNVGSAIAGNLSYPAEKIPALKVVAFDSQTLQPVANITTNEGDSKYELGLPAGKYFVVAYTLDGGLAGGYTQAVPCGLLASCTDHNLIAVEAVNFGATGDVNPTDWYAPPGTFPPMP
jgi:hypothetical protein